MKMISAACCSAVFMKPVMHYMNRDYRNRNTDFLPVNMLPWVFMNPNRVYGKIMSAEAGHSGNFIIRWLQKYFRKHFSGISEEKFYKAVNKVKPSLIRTESDELTYHFHVMIRYEIEKMLITGRFKTADIPACWNEQYKKWLDVDVPDDQQGCLQDVHWSHGSFGYFPTYSLGSFYAAQFFASAAKKDPATEG